LDDNNFFFPDSPGPIRRSRVGTGNPSATRFLKKAKRRPKGRRKKHSRKFPKVFFTNLPLKGIQDPEIFFTKIIKENETSIQIMPSDINLKDIEALNNSPSLMFEEVRVYEDEEDVTIEEEEEVGPVRRSNLIYQDGLRNVNAMIFNSQAVEERASRRKVQEAEVEGPAAEARGLQRSSLPQLESVPSTAIVMQVTINTMFSDKLLFFRTPIKIPTTLPRLKWCRRKTRPRMRISSRWRARGPAGGGRRTGSSPSSSSPPPRSSSSSPSSSSCLPGPSEESAPAGRHEYLNCGHYY
jgi:hypothetical protein